MDKSPPTWREQLSQAIHRLADQPLTLFLLLLAVNSLARPYSNCTHDARLYCLQVLNQAEHGAFEHDVFLRYGSQDRFSLFSRVEAPMVASFGVRPVFFVTYLIFNTLFVWGAFRLIRRLFTDPIVSTVALIFMLSAHLYYGGHSIFAVHEQFSTPRLMATGVVMIALERLIAGRYGVSLALLIAALLLHPLMACGGLMIWVGYLAHAHLPSKLFYGLLAGASFAGALLLAMPSLSLRLFGYMDEDWHEMVRLSASYNYPFLWSEIDILNQALALVLGFAGAAWLFRDDPVRSRFFLIATLAAIIGIVVTTFASLTPYAFLFQGQPYRAVWILKVLQIPLGFAVIVRLWPSPSIFAKLVTFGLTAFFCGVTNSQNEALLFVFALVCTIAYFRWLDEPVKWDWWWRSGVSACVISAFGWSLYRWVFIVAQRQTLLDYYDATEYLRLFPECSEPVVWIASALLLSLFAWRTWNNTRMLRCACLACALVVPTLTFGADVNAYCQRRYTRFGGDIAQARQVIEERATPGRVPTVYCSLGRAEIVWLDLHAASYFDAVQTAGVMFNRATGVELRRRVKLVNKFEMGRLRKEAIYMSDETKKGVERMFEAPFDTPEPTKDDLVRLAQEPGLDFIVVPQEFPGLYSAHVGRLFVYECDKVKNSSFSARAETAAIMSPTPRYER